MMQSLVILISGRGSNLQALITANLPVKSIVVISNNPSASGLAVAQSHQIATRVIDHRCYLDRDSFDAELARQIDRYQPDLIALAGFMRILGDKFINRYHGAVIAARHRHHDRGDEAADDEKADHEDPHARAALLPTALPRWRAAVRGLQRGRRDVW